ncbi:hypothetical protein NG791_13415 [Laspinema sp. D1]|uniref:hypothetical protein n=1 Tax=Laspinema palackyanum TaxID=3231601 RepID=UPI0034918761|nr:hypothetical protein [Laspinema sp. D2b]
MRWDWPFAPFKPWSFFQRRVFVIASDRHFTPSSFPSQIRFIHCPTIINIAKYYKNVRFSPGDSFAPLRSDCPELTTDVGRRSHQIPSAGFSEKNSPIFHRRQKAVPCALYRVNGNIVRVGVPDGDKFDRMRQLSNP